MAPIKVGPTSRRNNACAFFLYSIAFIQSPRFCFFKIRSFQSAPYQMAIKEALCETNRVASSGYLGENKGAS